MRRRRRGVKRPASGAREHEAPAPEAEQQHHGRRGQRHHRAVEVVSASFRLGAAVTVLLPTRRACRSLREAFLRVTQGAPLLLPAIVALPAFGAGWLITRSYRGVAERAKVGLLRALDELERKPLLADPAAPGSPRRTIARDIGETVREITREVRKAMEAQ